MLEDVLGWIVVLIGAIIIKFTKISIIDPLLSIGVAVFIFISALRHLKEITDLFLEKTPNGLNPKEIKATLCALEGVADVHHIHLWSIDGQRNYATMHIVTDSDPCAIKKEIRKKLSEFNVRHATLELEATTEPCQETVCHLPVIKSHHPHHHH
jgi:cobalt-zinc-cadmium efflux system protein